MENAQLIGLSRQIGLQRQMDVVANNIANINTTGFKAENILFEEYVMPVARDREFPTPDQKLSFTDDWATVHDMANGPIEDTGSPLDVALNGPGFLAVTTPQGERYTRAGSLQVNSEGVLVDTAGRPIVGDNGDIHFEPGDTDIAIASDGSITANGVIKGKLKLVEFPDPQQTERVGDNLWAGAGATPAAQTSVVQGSIEKSNVSGVSEITRMIQVQRAYEQVAQMLQQQDELERSAIQRLGSTTA
jgi:flagellar basal-body rod protein FlgF